MSDSDTESDNAMELSWAGEIELLENSGKDNPEDSDKNKSDKTGKQNPVHTENQNQAPKKVTLQESPKAKRARSEIRKNSRNNDISPRRVRSTSGIQETRSRSKQKYAHQKERVREKSNNGTRSYDNRRRYNSREGQSFRGKQSSSKSYKDQEKEKYLKFVDKKDNNELDLRSIRDDREDHIVVSDTDLNMNQNNILPILVHIMDTNSMQEIIFRINQCIQNAAVMKNTFITALIFQKFFPILGASKVIKIAEKITASILEQRAQLNLPPEKRNPAVKINHAIFQVHLTFGTIHYVPGWEHLWNDIKVANYRLKACNDRLRTNHFNTHIWLTKPAGGGRVQVRGSLYLEFSRKQGLGENLNDAGTKLLIKGLIRHHTYGANGDKSEARQEDTPIPLEVTSGYLMTEQNQENRWVDPHMATMAARLYEMRIQNQQQQEQVVIDANENVDDVFIPNSVEAETQTSPNDLEKEIQELKASIIQQNNAIRQKDVIIAGHEAEVERLTDANYAQARKLKDNQDEVCRKINKYEELAKAYQTKINKINKDDSKTEEKLSFYKAQYDRDQSKIKDLKISINKLKDDLQAEKDAKEEELKDLEEENQYLRSRLEEQKSKAAPKDTELKAQVDSLKHELACEKDVNESIQAQVDCLQKQVEALRRKNKET